MARAIWTGAISFGLVNVPVKLYAATSPKGVRFHQLSSKTGGRIRQKRVDSTTGDEVPFDDIVKGYEITPDRYVVITPEELDTLDPKATKTIDVEDAVPVREREILDLATDTDAALRDAGKHQYACGLIAQGYVLGVEIIELNQGCGHSPVDLRLGGSE